MEANGKWKVPLQRVMELYNEDGLDIAPEQATKILEFMQKMTKIAVNQYLKDGNTSIDPRETENRQQHQP